MAAERLQTSGDWYALLAVPPRRFDDETLALIRSGVFEESSAGRVFELVQGAVETLVNARTADLLRALGECAAQPDDVVMALERYDRACQRVLTLCDVRGLPTSAAGALGAEMTGYVANVFSSLRSEYGEMGSAAEDVAYCLLKLEKRWVAREQL